MANNDGFGSSEIMYPTVTSPGRPGQQLMPAAPYPAPAMPAYGGSPAQSGPELLHGTFNQTWMLNCLRRRWLMALFLGSLFAGLAAGVLLWLFPLSSSISALVHLQEETTDVMDDRERFSQQKLDNFQETQLSSIKSQFVLQSALSRPGIAQLDAVRKEEPDPISWLQDELRVGFQGENLSISFSGEEDSEEMKKVVDAVIAAYESEVLGKETIRTAQMRTSLTKMHKDIAAELKEKIDAYQDLAEELGGAESKIATPVLNLLIGEIRQIKMQIIQKKDQLIEFNIAKAVAVQQARSTTALDEAVAITLEKDLMLANYKAEEFAYTQKLRSLRTTSKTGNSTPIKQLEQSLAQLQQDAMRYRRETEAAVRKELKNAPNEMLTQLMMEYRLRSQAIRAEISALQAEHAEKVKEIEARGVSNTELAMLDNAIEQLRNVEKDMEHKLRRWDIQDNASDELFTILQDATAIDEINTLQRFALAGLGGIAAFCATCYGVALIEFRRRRLNSASDMDEGLGLRVLGVLPSVSSRKAMAPGGMIAAQLSESIDNVRATLLHDSTSSKRQVVLITSPATMEGTTTVASHLALSLTRAGRRTLLIDGDIREPALHKLFGLPLDEGFCEVLRSDIDVTDAIRPTNTEGLWLLTAGHCDMDAVHALATDQPQPIFEKLREEFDFIIIDGAPVLGLADSISIGQHVDGVILTVLRDHSEVRKVYQAMDLLKSMGIRLLGSVVNGVPIKADRRITQMHQSGTKPRKIADESSKKKKGSKKSKSKKASAKVQEPVTDLKEGVADDLNDGLNDSLNDLGLNEDVEIDFEDFGLEDDKS